jgi:arylsulfatase A-like enzyme
MRTNPPNILLVMNDDMGYSDIGCYGGEVRTPNLDRLADHGVRLTQFYNTARCCPTRASILTGLHPHQVGIGHMTGDLDEDGYRGDLSNTCVTIAEALKLAGYTTYMSGKWHVSRNQAPDGPKHCWPCQRGFDRYFGILGGAANYWQPSALTRDNDAVDLASLPEDFFLTDAISDQAADYIREHATTNGDDPFFLYTAYSAPHWPLHAHEDDIRRYQGRFAAGWDRLREERLQRMRDMGIVDASWPMTARDSTQPPWDEAPHQAWQQRRMEVYAAQVDRMDQGIGRIIAALEETNQIDNTLIMFLADNGACAEEFAAEAQPLPANYPAGTVLTRDGRTILRGNDPTLMPGAEDTYQSYGVTWANLSNTPFREYKHWVHEGGIATPLIAHWPSVIDDGGALRHEPGQLTDIMATCLDVAGADYPTRFNGNDIVPLEGTSLVPIFHDQPNHKDALIWEHEGNKAIRRGRWKLVCKYPGDWELYDLVANRTETNDLAEEHPEIVDELGAMHDAWAERCGVKSWEYISEKQRLRREKAGDVRNDGAHDRRGRE